jgi:hypothetical protein
MSETIYKKPSSLMVSLFEQGFPVISVSSNGRIDFSRDLTKTEKNNLDSFLEVWDDTPTTQEQRQEAYKQAGITAEKLIFALWKELKNADPTDAADLESRINAIDAQIN